MKTVWLDGSKPFYKANMHCHTTCSDGKMTPEQVKARYREHGYAIVAFTDHEHIIDQSHLTDDNFLAITACELGIKEHETHSTSVDRTMKVCHLNLYAKDPHNNDTPCYSSVYDHYRFDEIRDRIHHSDGEYQRQYSPEGINEMIRIANEKGFLVSYNHPRWSLESAADYLQYRGLWAMEIYNYGSVCMGIPEYNAHAYDDFLRAGYRLACIAGDDNHRVDDTLHGFTVINAETLDYAAVMTALEQHRFYASNGPAIHELYRDGDIVTMTFSGGCEALMFTAGRRVERHEIENRDEIHTVQFTLKASDRYVRFEVRNTDGGFANTCAYFLDQRS